MRKKTASSWLSNIYKAGNPTMQPPDPKTDRRRRSGGRDSSKDFATILDKSKTAWNNFERLLGQGKQADKKYLYNALGVLLKELLWFSRNFESVSEAEVKAKQVSENSPEKTSKCVKCGKNWRG